MNTCASSFFKRSILVLLLAVLGYGTAPVTLASDVKPPLMLANVYRPGIQLADYWSVKNMTACAATGMGRSC